MLLGLLLATPAWAGLPVAVNGQPLPTLADMLENVTPGVVNIATSAKVQVRQSPFFSDPFFRQFFDLPRLQMRERTQRSLGSGVIIDAKRGYILTNHHVIDKADTITVTLRDGRSMKAKLVGVDPETDVGVIQVEPKHLHQVPIGRSGELRVGDFVVAIGNPFGLGQTVTSGIVSALGRTGLGIKGYEDFIQTDASINPGNSGGALVNLRGELIGINTAILAKAGGNVGIGFAIPMDMAQRILAQLIEYGEVRRGLLGVKAQDLTPELAQAFGLAMDHEGALVTLVSKGSSAQKAGLRQGDVVTHIDDQPVRDAAHLRNMVGLLRVGERVRMTILRKGVKQTLSMVVAEPRHQSAKGDDIDPRLGGATLELRENEQGQMLITVAKLTARSAAARLQLLPKDVILSINKRPVNDFEQLKQAMQSNEREVLLSIQRGARRFSIRVRF
ncbi:putative protease Do [Magnetofaba australis IT-1]|uniref:Putative protease Do n=1 Tax=Magnetofaba australis IT-1 TaxID=1434232 RepID=A0A1Y2K1Z1_9PROT|nr:putative protease Do [Magnetofaba australis IT-1]